MRSQSNDVYALSDGPSHSSHAVGRYTWKFFHDSKECQDPNHPSRSYYYKDMKLTACKEDEFTCDNGQCVNMTMRCNQLPNCRDRSDERDCAILILENEYNKRVPPMIPIRGVVKNGLFTDRKGEGGPRL